MFSVGTARRNHELPENAFGTNVCGHSKLEIITRIAIAIIITVAVSGMAVFMKQGVLPVSFGIVGLVAATVAFTINIASLISNFKRNDRFKQESSMPSDTLPADPDLNLVNALRQVVKALKNDKDLKSSSSFYIDEVYIHSYSSGLIRSDRRFEFSKRLKTEEGQSIPIAEEDIYLKLECVHDKDFRFLDKDGLPTDHFYLPYSLFEGAKEGDRICFYYDENYLALTCRQSAHPSSSATASTFENAMRAVQATVKYEGSKALWPSIDIQGESSFMKTLMGHSHYQINSKDKKEIKEFQSFEIDQKQYGTYQELKVLDHQIRDKASYLLFNLHSDFKVDISEICLFESFGVADFHQAAIIIPHHPERQRELNKGILDIIVEGEPVTQKIDLNGIDLGTFEFKKSKTSLRYRYGQYYLQPLGHSKKMDLCYNSQGWLQLNIYS